MSGQNVGIISTIDALFESPALGAAELEAACKAAFSEFIQDRAQINRLIVEKIEAVHAGQTEFRDFIQQDVVLARGTSVWITLGIVSESHKMDLVTNPDYFFVASINDQPLVYRTFTPEKEVDWEVYSPDTLLVEQETRTAAPFEVVAFTNCSELFEFDVSNTTHLVRMYVTRDYHQRPTQAHAFSRETLKPLGNSASYARYSSLVYAAEALSELGNDSSMAGLEALSKSCRAHYVRWAALKAMAYLDADRALPAVQRAKDDVHPHVRRAAIAAEELLTESP